MCSLVTLILTFLTLNQTSDPATEAFRLENSSLSERNKITQGIFEVTSEGWSTTSGKRHDYKKQIRIVLDGTSLRNDIHDDLHEPNYFEVSSWGPRIVVSYTNRPAANGRRMVANVRELAIAQRLADNNPATIAYVVNPRALGICLGAFLNSGQKQLENCLGGRSIKQVHTVVDDDMDGTTCRKISFTNIYGVPQWVWIDPKRDHTVVRSQVLPSINGKNYDWDMRTKLTWVKSARRWFPETVDFKEVEDGQVVAEEHTTVRVISMNQPIDPNLFELATMNVEPGTGIALGAKKPQTGSLQWDGSSVEPVDPSAARRTAAAASSMGRFGSLGLAILCALTAAVLVWRVFARKTIAARP